MDMEFIPGLMGIDTKVNGKRAIEQARVYILGMMATGLKVSL